MRNESSPSSSGWRARRPRRLSCFAEAVRLGWQPRQVRLVDVLRAVVAQQALEAHVDRVPESPRATHHRVPAAAGVARVRPLVRCVRAPSLAPALACAHRASGAGRCRQTRTGPSADLIPNMHSHRFQRGSGHVAGLTKVPSPTKHTRTTGDERQQALAAHERYTHINCKAAESLTVGLCSARCQRPITSSLQRSCCMCANLLR